MIPLPPLPVPDLATIRPRLDTGKQWFEWLTQITTSPSWSSTLVDHHKAIMENPEPHLERFHRYRTWVSWFPERRSTTSGRYREAADQCAAFFGEKLDQSGRVLFLLALKDAGVTIRVDMLRMGALVTNLGLNFSPSRFGRSYFPERASTFVTSKTLLPPIKTAGIAVDPIGTVLSPKPIALHKSKRQTQKTVDLIALPDEAVVYLKLLGIDVE